MQVELAPPPTASRRALSLGAASLFFLSFLMSGNANVLPQLFYQHFYPERKVLLLAVTLFVSTLSSMAGVAASRRARIGRGGTLLALAATIAAAVWLLSVREALIYILLISAIQFADNYLLNRIDHAAVARSGAAKRSFNDVIGNVARLLGMLAAPAFFTAFYGNSLLLLIAVAVLGGVACGGATVLLRSAGGESATTDGPASGPLDRADRLLFGYAVSIYVALYLFAANMIYLIRDLLQMPGAELRGGRVIVEVFVAAALVNGTVGALRRPSGGGRAVRLTPLGAPMLALLLSGGLLAAGVRPSFPVFQLFGILVGGTYGLFLLELRGYASRGAREEGKKLLLTWFNNMANVSAVLAFGLMVALAVGRAHAPGALYIWTLALIAVIPAAGSALLLGASRAVRYQRGWSPAQTVRSNSSEN
jgi:hypothetical protein